MSKLILLIIFGILAYLLLKGTQRRASRPDAPPPPPAVENMVRCAHCGVHIPQSESIAAGGRYYCCDAHRR